MKSQNGIALNACHDVDDTYGEDDILEIDDELDVADVRLKIKFDELEQNMHDEVEHEQNDAIDVMLHDVIDEIDEIDETGIQELVATYDMYIYEHDDEVVDIDIVIDDIDEIDITQV